MAYGSGLMDVVQSSTANTPPQFNDGSGIQVGTLCRAWVMYKGTSTQSIYASFNVSSVTYNSTGVYTVNFTTALPDNKYACLVTGSYGSGNNFPALAPTTTAAQIQAYNTTTGIDLDTPYMSAAFFR